ncbi:glycerophosphodiester phosphodiesterase [Undibacterium sp.]|uniref:glycerophosphodiester phosphodiesterase n=1 Tax=Undibacterium sp. TaxID=1914977 RepID=UPI002CA15FD1|nr:glycerophosphodiester phosphodiesterase [Undibacterium sp.]HTD02630.1 glycerophosphodiester phosphodiesterase [Undibacterium sp.]
MWPYPKVVAHRGAGILAPENTLAAMQCGLDHGFHAVEFDVMLSKDGIPVLMHDPEFGRTVQGRGSVAQTLAADLLRMDAGKWFSPAYAGETVPTYEMVALFCQQYGIWMNVEIKPAPGFEAETGQAVAKLTRQLFNAALPPNPSLMQALPLFSSFSFDALVSAKAEAPDIPRGFLADTIPPDWQQRLQQLEAVALHTNHKKLTPALAEAVKQAGYGLFCYTVNQPQRAAEIMGWGVDAFCTDRIDLIDARFA